MLKIVWQQSLDETAWGIGQIGAMLAWAPLLVEMSYLILLQRKKKGKPESSSETNVIMHNLEEGKLQATECDAATSTVEVTEVDTSGKKMSLDSTNLCPKVNVAVGCPSVIALVGA